MKSSGWRAVLALGLIFSTRLNVAHAEVSSYISPEVLSTRAIFSRPCAKIIYSSNRSGLVRPFVVDMKNPAQPKVSEIELSEPEDFVAQALAPDCRTLAMVADRHGDGVFDVYLYDLENRSLRNITGTEESDEGKPVFAPRGHLLAYLANGYLALYDYAKGARLAVAPTLKRFQSILWSEDGESLYLDDEHGGIWQYDLKSSRAHKIWAPSTAGYSSHMIAERHGRLLFVSNHETEVRQIYQFDPRDRSPKRLYPTQYDQFSPIEEAKGRYTFRTNIDGSFVAAQLRDGKYAALSPPTGVVYDFSLDFGAPLLLYSNDQLPIGLYWFEAGRLRPLLPASSGSHQPTAIPIKNAGGMTNFLYLPSSKPSAWLIWLHGGPHEQVSPRYNLYFDFLARRNIAVYAINYPGSTGIGKTYELRDKGPEEKFGIQLSAIWPSAPRGICQTAASRSARSSLSQRTMPSRRVSRPSNAREIGPKRRAKRWPEGSTEIGGKSSAERPALTLRSASETFVISGSLSALRCSR